MNVPGALNIMLDLETLGIKPGCKILSIGACTFLYGEGRNEVCDYFSVPVDVDAQEKMDDPDIKTMQWWEAQSQEAKDAAFHSTGKQSLAVALTLFVDWVHDLATRKEIDPSKIYIWGKGATFDLPILEEACRRYCITTSWTFRAGLCHRTLYKIGKWLNIEEPEFDGYRHNAFHDAIHQAKYANRIFHVISGER